MSFVVYPLGGGGYHMATVTAGRVSEGESLTDSFLNQSVAPRQICSAEVDRAAPCGQGGTGRVGGS